MARNAIMSTPGRNGRVEFLVIRGDIGIAVSVLAAMFGGIAAWILVTRYLKVDFAWLPSTLFTVVAASTGAVQGSA